MSFGQNASFSEDRYGKASSALDLSFGYVQAPEGIYFSSEFTINVWIVLRSFLGCMRIIDFGNGASSDNIIFAFDCSNQKYSSTYITLNIFNNNRQKELTVKESILLNTWYFLTAVVNDSSVRVYYNGTFKMSGNCDLARNITRIKNYFGKSNWANDPYINAKIDDFKIYNRALNENEILEEMRAN